MTLNEFNSICAALPATTTVVQWGGMHVWKVGGKVFAIGVPGEDQCGFTVKTSPDVFIFLKEVPGVSRAPYLTTGKLGAY